MVIETHSREIRKAFSAFKASPGPFGLALTITKGEIGGDGEVVVLHLTKQEGLALLGNLAPAVMQAGDGSCLD